jgi:hypothetical protein
VIIGFDRRFSQILDRDILWRIGRISHAQVNHIPANSAFLVQESVDPSEKVRSQSVSNTE